MKLQITTCRGLHMINTSADTSTTLLDRTRRAFISFYFCKTDSSPFTSEMTNIYTVVKKEENKLEYEEIPMQYEVILLGRQHAKDHVLHNREAAPIIKAIGCNQRPQVVRTAEEFIACFLQPVAAMLLS